MSSRFTVLTVTDDSPDDGTAAAALTQFDGLSRYDWLTVDATLQGATDDTLDVYLQRLVGAEWVDWIHFAQLAASAASVRYTLDSRMSATSVATVGSGSSPALAAGAMACSHPGDSVRVWFEPGASTSAGASQTVRITCWKRPEWV